MQILNNKKGFTLIELLLYVSLMAIILVSVVTFLYSVLGARIKNDVINEVEAQGIHVMENIAQAVRDSDGINSPSIGTSGSSLSLSMAQGGVDPTVFTESGGYMYVEENAGGTVALTNDNIVVSSLTFQNLSRSSTAGVIRTSFVLTHINPGDINEYDYSKTFTTSMNLRHE